MRSGQGALAVAIHVRHEVGRIPDAHLDVPAVLALPEELAVAAIGLQAAGGLGGRIDEIPRIRAAARRLDDEVVLAVAIEIAHAHQRRRVVGVGETDELVGRFAGLGEAGHGHEVLAVHGIFRVGVHVARQPEVGCLHDRLGGELFRLAVHLPPDVERLVGGVGVEHAPGKIRALGRDGSDEAAVELLEWTLRERTLDGLVRMDGELVRQLQRLASLYRERAVIDGRRIDHAAVGPDVELTRWRRDQLREGDAFAGGGIREIDILCLLPRDVGGRASAREAAHGKRRRLRGIEAQGGSRIAAAPLAGGRRAVRRRAVERHVLNCRERVAHRDDVAALRIGRVDRHRARFLEGRLAGRARRVVQLQPDNAVQSVD